MRRRPGCTHRDRRRRREIPNLKLFTAQSWIKKEWLPLRRTDRPARGRGATALLFPRRVLQMAIAARLVDLGMRPKPACSAAWQLFPIGAILSRRRATSEGQANSMAAARGRPFVPTATAPPQSCVSIGRRHFSSRYFFPTGTASMAGSGTKGGATVLLLDFIVKGVAQQLAKLAERGRFEHAAQRDETIDLRSANSGNSAASG